jgi:hypothetical protein
MWSSYGGICLDSSWRHKNENVAPLTFLVTVDSNNKMIPGKFTISYTKSHNSRLHPPVSAMISSNVQESTLQTFLEVTKSAVESQAHAIQGKNYLFIYI